MQLLLRQILLTISYSDQFNFPLTTREIVARLIAPTAAELPLFSAQSWREALMQLQQKKYITYQNGFWSLNRAFDSNGAPEQRSELAVHTQKKLSDAHLLLVFFQYLPWVRAVAITGSAAVASAGQEDDLDFLVITARKRLWLVRILTVLLAFFAGKRRTWQKEEPDSWCFNLWLEEDQLVMPYESRSLYTAYEVMQAQWILDKDQVERQFIHGNNWRQHFLPYFSPTLSSHLKVADSFLKSAAQVLAVVFNPYWSVLNSMSYFLQRLYMQSHKTRERVALQYAFFHPRDTKKSIYENWKSSIGTITV